MANQEIYDELLERVMSQLADSVLALSDEAVLAEVSQSGSDPDEAAGHARLVLREAVQTWESVNRQLSNLGHAVNRNGWYRGWSGFHNACVNCGSFVSFTSTGEIRGEALEARCVEKDQWSFRRREASGK
jgi:hypothetical protein